MRTRFTSMLRRKGRYQERGVALAIALVLLGVLLVFTSVSATLMTTEARQTAAEYQKTRTFNAALAYLETITANVNRILSRSPNITAEDLGPTGITSNLPPFVTEAGQPLYTFTADTPFVPPGADSQTTVTVNDAPFNGMTALRRQFVLGASAKANDANEEARLIRQVNFYQIPAFQFAVFGFDCLQVSPGPQFYLGGRTHVNRHLYLGAGSRAWFFGPVTVAGEIVRQITPSNKTRPDNSRVLNPNRVVSGATPNDLADSVTERIITSLPVQKGPGGYSTDPAIYRVAPVNWLINDINLAVGPGAATPIVGAGPNNGGTGTPWGVTNGHSPGKQRIVPLLLPTQTNGFNAIEIIRRANPNENLEVLRNSRFFEGQVSTRATTIRILLDDDLDHFPPAMPGGVRAYDLEELSNPQTALFQQFWLQNNPNVVEFNPYSGSDHPDQPASVWPAGSGGPPRIYTRSDTLETAVGSRRRVLPPQTNLVNQQAYFQSTANNTDDPQRRKRTYIKIELLVNNNPGGNPNIRPERYDITPHILNLGITSGPIPVLRELPSDNLQPGQPEPETTYAAVYALNDGGSISRLQDQNPSNIPRNFLPFLTESSSPSFIGRFAHTFGEVPTVAISSPVGPVNQRVTYWYEPNTILTLQRTMIPFTPQTNVNLTNADPPQTDDRGRAVNTTEVASLRGRLTDDGNPATAGYPARFKSLLAKPYFRFTDDFDNRSYIKGSYDIGPDGARNTADDMFLMPNPMKGELPREEIFNGENSNGDKRQERFIRRVRVRASRLAQPTPQALPVASGLHPIATLSPDLSAPGDDPQYSVGIAGTFLGHQTSFNQIMRSPNFWTNDPASPARVLRVERQIVSLLRHFVFRPGIPGFYAMRHDNINILGNPVAPGAGANSLGDGRLDNDLDYLNQGPATYPTSPANAYITGPYTPQYNVNLNTTASDAPADGAPPTGYPGVGPTGVIDLQDMTPFANVNDQQLLAKCLFNPTGLTPAEQVRLFPHLLRTAPQFTVNFLQTLRSAELGTPGRSTDPSLGNIPAIGDFATAGILGTPEIARENLTFDWNGDGIIEPPHYPFENQRVDLNGARRIPNNEGGVWVPGDGDTDDLGEQMSALPRTVGTTNPGGQGVPRMGYSPESNLNSLLPSTLRVLHTPPPVNNLNCVARRTTSMPIEIIFWEAAQNDPDPNFAPLPDPEGGLNTVPNQADPGGTSAVFPPSSGFTETGEFQNCFRIKVPFNTFLGKTTSVTVTGLGTVRFNVREAVAIIFQHPLASRVYPTAAGIDPTGIGPTTPQVDGGLPVIGPGAGTKNLNLETQIGRRLGLSDAHYAFPGHAYIAFTPNPSDPLSPPPSGATLIPRIRIEMDRAFPINVYDQREGRHVNRRYGFQGIPTASDYYDGNIGGAPNRVLNTVWPAWPGSGNADTQLADDQRILANMAYKFPMPSPICYERRGLMNLTDLNVGNLKRLFRGDFDAYLSAVEAATSALTANPAGFISGRPVQSGIPGAKIDISDNGFIVYFSDRRGDFNNDGIYDFNDVYGENNVLNALDDSCETDPGTVNDPQQGGITVTYANVANSPGPKPGDGRLRRDVACETQPRTPPTLNTPARSGEAPHGAVPVNDGYEYFGASANPAATTAGNGHGIVAWATRYTYTPNPDGTRTISSTFTELAYPTAGPANPFPSELTATVNGGTGMRVWRIVDSAKTGRVRAFRRALRITNAMDIPRHFINRPVGNGRGFTGLTIVTENPSYLYGNINAIGVTENIQNGEVSLNSRIPRGGPTPSENYAQTGNANVATPPPSDWCSNPLEPNDPLLHGSMGIYSDATSIHSNGWSDGRMFLTGFNYTYRPQSCLKRTAVRTTVKAAWLTGAPRTGAGNNNLTGQVQNGNSDAPDPESSMNFDNNTDGGLHNFPRFAEDFGGALHSRNFNYNGSFIFQFFSHQGNGPFLIGGDGNYTPPNPRNWNFDTAFLVPTGVPAGTPFFFFYKNGSYRQVFLENNPN